MSIILLDYDLVLFIIISQTSPQASEQCIKGESYMSRNQVGHLSNIASCICSINSKYTIYIY